MYETEDTNLAGIISAWAMVVFIINAVIAWAFELI